MMSRYFAIIPAAGLSTRMGRPKLLLSFGEGTLISGTISAWRQSRVDAVLAVARSDDSELAAACRHAGAAVVAPDAPPPDMKVSVQAALQFIQQHLQPAAHDAFLVAPADMPRLSPAIIDRLIEQHALNDADAILVPFVAGQRGHPVLFPWPMASLVNDLATQEGLNVLVDRGPMVAVPCDDLVARGNDPFADIDTPEDYQRLQ